MCGSQHIEASIKQNYNNNNNNNNNNNHDNDNDNDNDNKKKTLKKPASCVISQVVNFSSLPRIGSRFGCQKTFYETKPSFQIADTQ